jgi:hypothetical protein
MPASLTEVLAKVAVAARSAGPTGGLVDEVAELERIAHRPIDAALEVVVPQQDQGHARLLGTALTAAPYAALLWNGERFHRESIRWSTRLTFLALTVVGPDAPDAALTPAVRGGETLRQLWPPAPSSLVTAGLTTDVVSAAVCAALASTISEEGMASVVELAASLMLVTPTVPSSQLAGMHAGHSLAAGWLAVQLHHCGVVGAPGAATDVLAIRELS